MILVKMGRDRVNQALRRSHDKSPCDDRSGRQSSNKTSAHKDCRVKVPLNDAKECNDGPSSRSVKGKDGKIHRRPSESKHKQDDGDELEDWPPFSSLGKRHSPSLPCWERVYMYGTQSLNG